MENFDWLTFYLDPVTAELPLFRFWTKGGGRKSHAAEYEVVFWWRRARFYVSSPKFGIPSFADRSVFFAMKAMIGQWRGNIVIRKLLTLLWLSDCWANYAMVRESAFRIADTEYRLEFDNGERFEFRILDGVELVWTGLSAVLREPPSGIGSRRVRMHWETYSKLATDSLRRMYEIAAYAESAKPGSASFKYSDLASAFPLNSGKMNKVYFKKYAEWLVKAGLAESFDAASDPKRISFCFKRSVRLRAPKSSSVREKSDRSRKIDRSSYTIDSEIPKSDVFLRRALLEVYGHRCFYTKDPITLDTLTVDHVVPVSSGGADCISNYVPVTKTANSRKNAHYSPEDSAELRAIVRAVYAGKVLAKYLALRKDFYSSPWDAAKTAVTSMFSKTY